MISRRVKSTSREKLYLVQPTQKRLLAFGLNRYSRLEIELRVIFSLWLQKK